MPNESTTVLINQLLDLFFINPKELSLLEDIVDIFIQIPFKSELFKQLVDRIDKAQVPTLPLLIKVIQS